jgi:hypothetical protein
MSASGRSFVRFGLSCFDLGSDVCDAHFERIGDSPDGHPAGAVQPALDARKRRGGEPSIESELFLCDLAIFAKLFEMRCQRKVRFVVHTGNMS